MNKLTVHQISTKFTYSRNRLRAIISEVEFEERYVDSDTFHKLEHLLNASSAVLDYLSSFSAQTCVNLPEELQIIYNETINIVKELEEA